jgi:hypothetical protein
MALSSVIPVWTIHFKTIDFCAPDTPYIHEDEYKLKIEEDCFIQTTDFCAPDTASTVGEDTIHSLLRLREP